MPEITVTILGNPIAKKRPRFARQGRFVRTYSDQQKESEQTAMTIRRKLPEDFVALEGPVVLGFEFFMPITKSTSKKNASFMLSNHIKHIKKPDMDNLIKFYKDCMNGIVYKDDSQAWKYLEPVKLYSIDPRTVITVVW